MLKFSKIRDIECYTYNIPLDVSFTNIRREDFLLNDLIIFNVHKTTIIKNDNIACKGYIFKKEVVEEYLNKYNLKNVKFIVFNELFSYCQDYKRVSHSKLWLTEDYFPLEKRTIILVSPNLFGIGGIESLYENIFSLFQKNGLDVRLWGRDIYINYDNLDFQEEIYVYAKKNPITNDYVVDFEKFIEQRCNMIKPIWIISDAINYSTLIDYIKIDTVIYHHNSNYQYFDRHIGKLLKKKQKDIDLVLTMSNSDSKEVNRKYNFNVDCVYNYCNIDNIENHNELSEDLVWAGRINSIYKQPMELIKIANKLKQVNSKRKIHIYSNFDKSIEFIREIDINNLNDIFVLHHYERDLGKIYNGKGTLLLTSNTEGCPMVIIEALVYGLKVITYDCSSFIKEYYSKFDSVSIVQDSNEAFEVINSCVLNNGTHIEHDYMELTDANYVFNEWMRVLELSIKNRVDKYNYYEKKK